MLGDTFALTIYIDLLLKLKLAQMLTKYYERSFEKLQISNS